MASQKYLCTATILLWVIHRTALMVSFVPIRNKSLLVLDRFNYAQFSRSRGTSFARHFVYSSGRMAYQTYLRHATVFLMVYHRTALTVSLDIKFISFRTRPVCGEKAGSSRLKCHLDSAAWVLSGEVNAIKTALAVTRDLPHNRVRLMCASS